MNSPKTFEENFLCCGICYEIFHKPKVLPCLHTFCNECLSSYIKTTSLVENRTGFRCPTCREVAKPLNPDQTDWSSQFRDNFYIASLIEANENQPSLSGTDIKQKLCPNHHKVLELFCVDCDKIMCVQCSVISHRSCRQIIPVQKIAQEKRALVEGYKMGLQSQISKLAQTMNELQREKENTIFQNFASKQEIKKCGEELQQMVIRETASCIAKFDKVTSDNQHILDVQIMAKLKLLESIESVCRTMNTVITAPDSYIFDGFNDVIEQRRQLLTDIPRSYSIPVFKTSFIQNQDWRSGGFLGKIEHISDNRTVLCPDVKTTDVPEDRPKQKRLSSVAIQDLPCHSQQIPSPFFDKSKCLTMVSEMKANIKSDKSKPCLRDITVVSGNILVVTDYANNRVKSFYWHGNDYNESHVSVSAPPHAVSTISLNQVAVTLPKSKQIAIICVNPNVTLEKLIQTTKKYWGVTNIGKTSLAVSTCPASEPGAVDIIDLDGHIVKSVLTAAHPCLPVSNPLYLTSVSSGDIIISDCTVNRVLKLRQNGDILFGKDESISKFSRPMGVACDANDAILIIVANNTIIVVSEEGEKMNTFLLQSQTLKKRTIRSLAIAKNQVYVITDASHILIFQLV